MSQNEVQKQVSALLTWSQVYAWARKQPGDVGYPLHPTQCPLARYLDDVTEPLEWVVDEFELSIHGEDDSKVPLPQWAVGVVHEVDQYGCGVAIPAWRFLGMLDICKPGCTEEETEDEEGE